MRLTNTLTGQLEELEPLEDGRIGIYVCGVTPYEESHVGHAMSAIIYDVLVRYLRWEGKPQGGLEVTYVSNYTDIDDKVIERAAELGRDPLELVAENIEQWEEQQAALNLTPPDVRPRVTQHIATIGEAIEAIVEAGYGYVTDGGDVYYRVRAKDDYGKLSHQDIEQLESGTRGEPGEGKEFPLDFALWKAAKATSQGEETSPGGEPHWPSPWGEGRPGWHIECSAMSQRELGATFDIHGGGLDLVFPHHENEVAQAEAVSGVGTFARTWLHNGLVQRDGEKMSKSIGNVVTVSEALERWRPDALRLFVLGSHYRSPNNLTDDAMAAAESGVDRLTRALHRDARDGGIVRAIPGEGAQQQDFVDAMEDDLNTPRAIAVLFNIANAINRHADAGHRGEDVQRMQRTAKELSKVLGLRLASEVTIVVPTARLELSSYASTVEASQRGADRQRNERRVGTEGQISPSGDLSLALLRYDQLLPRLLSIAHRHDVPIDGLDAEGTANALVRSRESARGAKDFARADAIRADLSSIGIELEDTSEGTRVVPRRVQPS